MGHLEDQRYEITTELDITQVRSSYSNMMSRSTSATRQLSLTEELERLEQQITLTLQEIDHNFSRAHRIVTSSILPIIDQYAEHSNNVWEGSKVCDIPDISVQC